MYLTAIIQVLHLVLNYYDEMSGETTLNPGIVTFNEKGGAIEVSMRYSVTYPFDEKMTEVQAHMAETPFILDVAGDSKPHYVPEEDEISANASFCVSKAYK